MTGISSAEYLLQKQRQHFPALANKAYFNYGGQGPLPEIALDAILTSYKQIEQMGPFSGKANAWIEREAKEIREIMAAELGVTPESISLTEDVTVGCNIALWGIDWHPGDHLLLTDCEHQGVIAAVQELQRRYDIEVSICPLMQTLNDGNPREIIAKYLRYNTRLVVLSHILWNTGQVLPLEDIVLVCRQHSTREKSIKILVDAAQSVGVLPLNLSKLEVDFYAFTGHKWWCGPAGLGGLYIKPSSLESLNPTFIGWRGILVDAQGEPIGFKPDSKKFEIATSAIPLYAGLKAAISLHNQCNTVEERYQRLQNLSKYLWEELNKIEVISCLKTSPPEAGLVSFQLSDALKKRGIRSQDLVKFIEEKNILLRTLLKPDCIRACVHYFTLESEIELLVSEISNFCKNN